MMDLISRYKRVDVTIRYDDSSLYEWPGSIPAYDDLSFERFPELCHKFDQALLGALVLLVKESGKLLDASKLQEYDLKVKSGQNQVAFEMPWSQVSSVIRSEIDISLLNLQTQVLVQVCEFLASKVGEQNVNLVFQIDGD